MPDREFTIQDTLFGTFYPTGFVASVFQDTAGRDKAHSELHRLGFADVRSFSADEILERHEAWKENRSLLDSLASAFAADEKVAVDRYVRAARDGQPFLFFCASENLERLPEAIEVLKAHGASLIYHYGTSMLTAY